MVHRRAKSWASAVVPHRKEVRRRKRRDSPKKLAPRRERSGARWWRRTALAAEGDGAAQAPGTATVVLELRSRQRRSARDGAAEIEVWGRRGDDRSDPLFMRRSGAVSDFPAHDLPNRGWDRFVPSNTWRHPEHSIWPHHGPHTPNGWNSDLMWLPAREPEQRCAKSKTLKCFSGSTRPRVGPSPRRGIFPCTKGEVRTGVTISG